MQAVAYWIFKDEGTHINFLRGSTNTQLAAAMALKGLNLVGIMGVHICIGHISTAAMVWFLPEIIIIWGLTSVVSKWWAVVHRVLHFCCHRVENCCHIFEFGLRRLWPEPRINL